MDREKLKELNATTWEDLNPDWKEAGELTDRFAQSEFDLCPAGHEGTVRVFVATEDCDVAVKCSKCSWHVYGDCPSEAIDNWNLRSAAASAWVSVKDGQPDSDGWYFVWVSDHTEPEVKRYVIEVDGTAWWNCSGGKVIAWMPIPPYEQGETI